MKKLLIALMIVMAMLAITACGTSSSDTPAPDALSGTDASSADISGSDLTPTDLIDAPEGYVGCIVGDIYFCYPEAYTKVLTSDSDSVNIIADSSTGANFSVKKSTAVGMDVSLLSRSDLDAIGEKGAADLKKAFGEGVETSYTYIDSGAFADGKGVYFDFDITVNYTLEFSQTLSYRQVYIGKGSDVYFFTFAVSKTFGGSVASEYFADVADSIELRTEK